MMNEWKEEVNQAVPGLYGSVVIAGGGLGEQFEESHKGVRHRALLQIHGVPMVTYVIRALRETKQIGRIALIAPSFFSEYPFAGEVDHLIPEERDETENILKGIEALYDVERILMVTSDIPLIRGAILDDFFSKCPRDADICYPIVEKKDIMKMFPDRSWVFVKLREGRFTGSSMFLFQRDTIAKRGEELKKVMESRRNVLRLASCWGLPIIIGLLTGTLAIEKVENRISAVLNCRCKGIVSEHPEIALDVDKPSDIEAAERILEQGRE